MAGPLEGVRVLDLSRILAGPWASQTLADLGAEVVKVERPGVGDDTRGWGPPWLADREGRATAESAYFLSANRGKRSITVEFAKPEGQEVVRRLAAASDILIENYKAGGLAKFGLDYEGLRAANPRLIYCSITGFGQTGPYRKRAGYDFLLQAMGGLMSVTGEPDGEPMKVGVAITDILTGMYAATAVLAALAERERSGEGQHIDLALLRRAGRHAGEPGDELPGLGRGAAAARQRAPERRALPGVPDRGRVRGPRGRQRRAVPPLRRLRRAAGAGRGRALPHQRRAGPRTAPRWSRPSARSWPSAPRPNGWRCWSRRGCLAALSTGCGRPSPIRRSRRGAWWRGSPIPWRGRCRWWRAR